MRQRQYHLEDVLARHCRRGNRTQPREQRERIGAVDLAAPAVGIDAVTLTLASDGAAAAVLVGGFLGPIQKGALADDLTHALSEVKRGVTRTHF